MAFPTAFRTDLANEVRAALANWKISLSPSQFQAFLSHIEAIINNDSGTVLANVTTDLAASPEPAHGHHT